MYNEAYIVGMEQKQKFPLNFAVFSLLKYQTMRLSETCFVISVVYRSKKYLLNHMFVNDNTPDR